MFSWFKRKENIRNTGTIRDIQDEIEESLWEIKEEYDLATEEVDIMVESKRKNFQHMHEMIFKKNKE
tara:strand:- start:250 stop:450 length:201 start_codon:yes stop_codon:yes gene_type:complete